MFTFWPPGPPDRLKEISPIWRGMALLWKVASHSLAAANCPSVSLSPLLFLLSLLLMAAARRDAKDLAAKVGPEEKGRRGGGWEKSRRKPWTAMVGNTGSFGVLYAPRIFGRIKGQRSVGRVGSCSTMYTVMVVYTCSSSR